VNLKLFMQILLARKQLVIFVFLATIAATVLVTLNAPRRYTTSTTLVIDSRDIGPFEQAGVNRQLASGYLMTQVDIIGSRNVALKALEALEPADLELLAGEYLGRSASEALDDPAVRDGMAGKLIENLSVTPPRESRVLSIRFTSSDPNLSAKVADALAQAYIDAALQLTVEPARRNAAWFDSQLGDLRARLEEKQKLLSAYQEDKGIVAIDERLDTETQRFEDLSSGLIEAQARTRDVRSRQLGVEHPEYKRALENERSIEQSLELQKQRVFRIKQERDELDLLVRDVENARKTYDLALQEFYQNSMESQFNQTNIAVLNKAAVVYRPTSPNWRMNIALGTLLGLVFGVGLALVAEALGRRVRIEEDLSDAIGVPVLTSL
jgi:uncharacterized protein involved in exopolysaccharide biosynthesis